MVLHVDSGRGALSWCGFVPGISVIPGWADSGHLGKGGGVECLSEFHISCI